MSRFLYAVLCVLLVAWAAYGQQYTVESKLPKYTVASKMPAKAAACPCGTVCQCPAGVCPNCPVQMQALQVCQNGQCSVVSSPTQSASTSRAREGWYLGKNLGRRR